MQISRITIKNGRYITTGRVRPAMPNRKALKMKLKNFFSELLAMPLSKKKEPSRLNRINSVSL